MPDRMGETPMMDEKLRLDMYRKMILSRRLEERIAELIKSGQAGGFMHPGVGQEALQVAAICCPTLG
jgi:TPP-dependent pyruvate/acetoin dehydrogenase alpha subunit